MVDRPDGVRRHRGGGGGHRGRGLQPTPGAVEGLCLAAVSVAGNYPRASPSHVRAGAAPALAALVLVLATAPTALAVVLAALATLGGLGLVASWRRPGRAPEVEVDVLDGLPLLSPMPARSLTDGKRVRDTAGRRVLVLRSDAAQWYLALEMPNPTPYEPLASTFGRAGQEDVAARLRRSDVEWCLMAPADAVRSHRTGSRRRCARAWTRSSTPPSASSTAHDTRDARHARMDARRGMRTHTVPV